MLIKELFFFIWGQVPWWLKWPMVILLTPTALIMSFLSWHSSTIHATIRPYEERRDIVIKSMDDKLNSMDRKLDILIQRR
jgi:hypothetical protein